MTVAWDIETCPQPLDALGPRQRRRYELLLERARTEAADRPFDEAEASRRVRSLHPALGWICCASFVRLGPAGEPCAPRSFTAAGPDAEAALLTELWATVAQLGRRVQWVTFNGKRFDVEWLATRTAAHGLVPSRMDLLHRHPYVHWPHADLITAWRSPMALDDLCELLQVESPKEGAVTAATVALAVEEGRLADVAAYCEADVVATLNCWTRIAYLFHAHPPQRTASPAV